MTLSPKSNKRKVNPANVKKDERLPMRNHNGQAKPNRGQGPVQLEHIEAIEKRLWNAADTLRSNSNYASNENFMPVT